MQGFQMISCPICLTDLTAPVSISCGHTFCKQCLLQLLEKQQFPSCPLCRKPTFSPLSGEWAQDDLLTELVTIVKEEGEKGLFEQFSSIVMCLSCGLTPVQPTVLACQHLFCQDCIRGHLKEELICPACNEWATYLPTSIPINTKYQDLVEWYELKLQQEQSMKQEINNVQAKPQKVCGMPVFFYDQLTHIQQQSELVIVEDRYKQLLRIVTNGSGHFPVITLYDSELPIYADLVQITKIKQLNAKQVYVQVIGAQRLVVHAVYTMNQNGNRVPFNLDYYRNHPGQLWMCDFEVLHDDDKHNNQELAVGWFKVCSILQAGYDDLPVQLKEIFIKLLQQMTSHKGKQGTEEFSNIEDSSLLLIRMLNIPAKKYQPLYYSSSLSHRVASIYRHLCQIQQKILALVGQDKKQMEQEEFEDDTKENTVHLANNNYEEEEEDQEIQLLQFNNLTLSQTIFVNCFKLENLVQH